ncbi:MAG: hypothetical protein KIT56_05895 [Gammaproteobacteria bacterium]|nr:hypothetical protein [Gammaproteobacteria bacterium]MCW5583401.1 hypothetical protein [Gammaproteobacteria bacterium]
MQDKLVIYLHAHDMLHPSWMVVDTHRVVTQSVFYGNPAELSLAASDKEVVVIVPGEDILLTSVMLPKMSRARLVQALPYALEEQLISDIEELHFALGEPMQDGSIAVAIVAREKIQEWLALLQSWKIQADVFLPMTLVLPFQENEWQILVSDIVIVRTGICQGFICDKSNLNEWVAIALSSGEKFPDAIHIHNYTPHTVAAELSAPVNITEDFNQPEQLYKDLALHVAHSHAMNLLQGAYKTKKFIFPRMRKIWNFTFYLVMTWVALLFLYPTVSYFILKQRLSGIETQMAQIYKRNFPQASSMIAPKLRMEEKLHKLMAQVENNKLLVMIDYLDKAAVETPNITLKRFDFQNNQLTLEITALSSEDIDKFTHFLTQQGFNLKQQSANLIDARINATIVME